MGFIHENEENNVVKGVNASYLHFPTKGVIAGYQWKKKVFCRQPEFSYKRSNCWLPAEKRVFCWQPEFSYKRSNCWLSVKKGVIAGYKMQDNSTV